MLELRLYGLLFHTIDHNKTEPSLFTIHYSLFIDFQKDDTYVSPFFCYDEMKSYLKNCRNLISSLVLTVFTVVSSFSSAEAWWSSSVEIVDSLASYGFKIKNSLSSWNINLSELLTDVAGEVMTFVPVFAFPVEEVAGLVEAAACICVSDLLTRVRSFLIVSKALIAKESMTLGPEGSKLIFLICVTWLVYRAIGESRRRLYVPS